MAYPVRPRQSSRIVTTNVEESAEVEVAVLAQNKAKDRIIRNVNQELLLSGKKFFDRYAVLLERAKSKGLISFCEVSS